MSEDVIGKLARFTPGGVDRDAMLFAAGRASVRPTRVWKWATAALVVSQAVTLGLWLRPRADTPPPAVVPQETPPEAPSPYPTEPNTLMAFSANLDARPEALPTRLLAGPSAPLTAFTRDLNP